MILDPVALYELRIIDPERPLLVGPDGEVFPTRRYARFKHGAVLPSRTWGVALGRLLISRAPWLTSEPDAPVLLLAPTLVPNSATVLAKYVFREIDRRRAAAALEPVVRLTALPGHDATHYSGEGARKRYSAMTHDERQAYVSRYPFHVPEAELLRDRRVVVLDDLMITGTTMRRLCALAEDAAAGGVLPTALVLVDPAEGTRWPAVEARMNEAGIDGVESLLAIQAVEGWTLTSMALRLLKARAGDPGVARLLQGSEADEAERVWCLLRGTGREAHRAGRGP